MHCMAPTSLYGENAVPYCTNAELYCTNAVLDCTNAVGCTMYHCTTNPERRFAIQDREAADQGAKHGVRGVRNTP